MTNDDTKNKNDEGFQIRQRNHRKCDFKVSKTHLLLRWVLKHRDRQQGFSLVDDFARILVENYDDETPFDEIGECFFPDNVAEVCRQQVIVHLREFLNTHPESTQLFIKDLNMGEEMMALVTTK